MAPRARTRQSAAGAQSVATIRALSRMAIVALVAFVGARAVNAAPLQRLAVLELRDLAGLAPAEAAYLTDRVRGGASRALPPAQVLVLTRESLEPLLPAGRSLAECATASCEVEIGRRVGADYVMSGEVLRFGGALRLQLKLHHCGTAAFLGSETVAGEEVAGLERGIDAAAARLSAPLRQHAGLVTPVVSDSSRTPVPSGSVAALALRPRQPVGMAVAPNVPAADEPELAGRDEAVLTRERLQWTARDNGRDLDWHEAWRHCDACREGGARDWRLPTIEELETLRVPGPGVAPRAAIARERSIPTATLWSVSMARVGVALRYDFTRDRRTRAPFTDRRGARVLCVRRRAE